jgi:hypothetical protein
MHNQFPKRTKAATNNSSNVQTRTPASGSEGLNRTVKRGFTVLCSMRHVIPVGLQRHLEFATVTVHVLLNQDVRGSFITGKFLSAYPKRRVQSSVPIFVGGRDECDTHEVTKAQLFRWTCGAFRFRLPNTVNPANANQRIAQSTTTFFLTVPFGEAGPCDNTSDSDDSWDRTPRAPAADGSSGEGCICVACSGSGRRFHIK